MNPHSVRGEKGDRGGGDKRERILASALKVFAQKGFFGAKVSDVTTNQLSALGASTRYVTISVGGNDAGFTSVITTCAEPAWLSNCGAAVKKAEDLFTTELIAATPGVSSRSNYLALTTVAHTKIKLITGYATSSAEMLAMERGEIEGNVMAYASVNTIHNDFLDWFTPGASRHPVFGKITSGQDVVKKIEGTPTDGDDRPRTPVQVIKVTVTGA